MLSVFCHASDVGIFFPLISFFGLYMSTLPIYLITYVQKKWEYLFFVECWQYSNMPVLFKLNCV